MDEFELIRRFFTRDTRAPGVVVGVGDDGAVLRPSAGMDQVQVIDSLVADVHFPARLDAANVGYRVVAVNLSDIASMGAIPRWMTLALTLSDEDERWVEDFAKGLIDAASEYDVALVGGDTTQGAVVVATVHITGEVEKDSALLRSTAQVGDAIFVSGTVGDASAGLALIDEGTHDEFLVNRFLRPSARIDKGRELRGKAHAAIDISDGLVGDLRKMLDASGVGAEIDVGRVPLSGAIVDSFGPDKALEYALTGGDDYELCFTAPIEAVADVADITAIGVVTESRELICRLEGDIVEVDDSGYRHFQ